MSAVPTALVTALGRARRVVVMTGAGISAESGVPTFREAQTGLWARFDAEELATPQAFARDPATVWRWYAWRRELVDRAEPNAGHRALVALAGQVAELTLITQNVDGLHQRAGSASVLELHGNLHRTICAVTRRPIDAAALAAATDVPPPSPHADGGLARPDVVWFGETLPAPVLEAAAERSAACDVFFSVGTSSLVEPAASLGRLAAQRGAVIVEVNPTATPLTARADHVFREPAGEALPRIVAALNAG